LLAVLCLSFGCKELPNPETDEVARMLRYFDSVQRPDGQDLPLERFFAWTAERDAGARPADVMTEDLQVLVDQQRLLVARIKRIRTTSKDGLAVLEAYLGAHIDGHRALEQVLNARRLGDAAGVSRGEKAIRTAFTALRGARAVRTEVTERLGVQLKPPPGPRGGPTDKKKGT